MVYNFKIITNNELVFEKYGNEFEVDYKPGTFEMKSTTAQSF